MELKGYFFDTYALFELVKGNERYLARLDKVAFITTRLNLLELHYGLLAYGEKFADQAYDSLAPYAVEIDDEVVKQANRLKAKFKKQNLSYVDCIGYVLARSRGVAFLTGDRQFKGLENVEFLA